MFRPLRTAAQERRRQDALDDADLAQRTPLVARVLARADAAGWPRLQATLPWGTLWTQPRAEAWRWDAGRWSMLELTAILAALGER
jgi:hypothetical protein